MKDLILVAADKNMHFALRGALNRPEAMGIRPVTFEFLVHPGRDGGVRKNGPELIRLKRSTACRGLMILDYEGCGSSAPALDLEAELNARLVDPWGDDAKALVIQPELDVWMWGAENSLRTLLKWSRSMSIRDWLKAQGFTFSNHDKPTRPKEALEAVLKELGTPRSSALYEDLAEKLSLRRCKDAAFIRLRDALRGWFPTA